MVISSTYAWFTLSTAPEVKGINTAIGANGALEMALTPVDGSDPSDETTTGKTLADINNIWGNLVQLYDDTVEDGDIYGAGKITLYPSRLVNSSIIDTDAAVLATPVYGADGRVSDVANNAIVGIYNPATEGFYKGTGYGFRGIGVSSSMSPRQLAYSNALSSGNTYISQAQKAAGTTLNTYGSTLGTIIVRHAAATETNPDTYTAVEVQTIIDMVNGISEAVNAIDDAYVQYVIAFVAATGAKMQEGETEVYAYTAVPKTSFKDAYDQVITWIGSNDTAKSAFEGVFKTVYEQLYGTDHTGTTSGTIASIATATNELPTVTEGKADYTWADTDAGDPGIRDALSPLVNTSGDKVNVNGITIAELGTDEGKSQLGTAVANQGVKVNMKSGAGVFADVADHCGNYNAAIKIKGLTYGGITFEELDAQMQTQCDAEYAKDVADAVKFVGTDRGGDTTDTNDDYFPFKEAEGANDDTPFSSMYGYIVDLSFRTNASDSNLLLQTVATDRIYDTNSSTAPSFGGGSTMSFESSANITNEQMEALVSHIKIVFFDTKEGTVYATAGLDYSEKTSNGAGFDIPMYLLDENGFIKNDDEGIKNPNAVITGLNQNQVHQVSVLVYLDGETLTNADVPASVSEALTGKLNLQFSSSASLDPMNYGDLMSSANNTPAEGEGNN